ncbi:Lysine--tRNA ligase, chloroplastic/mitochondrial [Orobanche minor]
MIANPEVADVVRRRAKIISEIWKTLESAGFIEVETPVLQGAAGGAEAPIEENAAFLLVDLKSI